MHAIVRTIVSARTKFQNVEIMETASYGKCLVLDGRIQSSAADEFVYHEALVHPGMLAAARPPRTALKKLISPIFVMPPCIVIVPSGVSRSDTSR